MGNIADVITGPDNYDGRLEWNYCKNSIENTYARYYNTFNRNNNYASNNLDTAGVTELKDSADSIIGVTFTQTG